MALPSFTLEGDLPCGVHRATLREAMDRFGNGSLQRRAVSERLSRIHALAISTGRLARFIVFGSFVTSKENPKDVDIVMLMEDSFELANVADEAAIVFHHLDAQACFGASVFWARRSGALGGEQAMVEYWQIRRDGGRRGIVEIAPEEP